MLKRLLIILAFSTALTGCSVLKKEVILHPVTDQDIKIGGWCQEGWICMSEGYLKEVVKARLGQ